MSSIQKLKRQILQTLFFTLLIVIFVVALLLAILSSQGNTINPDGGVVSTGVIRIIPSPRIRYTAILNGEQVRVNSDRIEWINPGVVKLTLAADGYKEWKKEVLVKEGVVTDLYVQFIPENLNIEQITDTNISNLVFSNDGSQALFLVSNDSAEANNGIWRLRLNRSILNLVRNEPQKLLSLSDLDADLISSQDLTLEISEDNSILLISSKSFPALLVLNMDNFDLKQIFPSRNLRSAPQNVSFFQGGKSLIFQSGKAIYEYVISSKRFNLILDDISDASISVGFNQVFFVEKSNEIYIYENEKIISPKESERFRNNEKLMGLITSSQIKQIYVNKANSARDNLVISTSNDEVYFVDLNNDELLKLDIASVKFISRSGRLLFGRNTSGELISVLVESRQGGRRNTLIQSEVNIPDIVSKIHVSQNDRVLVYFVNSANGVELVRQDYDGNNKNVLMGIGVNFLPEILLTSSNDELYLVYAGELDIQDAINLNLYKISLISL